MSECPNCERLQSERDEALTRAAQNGEVMAALYPKIHAAEAEREQLQREALTLRNAAVNAAEERDRLHAALEYYASHVTDGDIAREALGPAQETKHMEARCVSGSNASRNPDIREDTVRQARDIPCDASALDRGPDQLGPAEGTTTLRCDCPTVKCARCGKVDGPMCAMRAEEGDEWECPACNDRCNAAEKGEP